MCINTTLNTTNTDSTQQEKAGCLAMIILDYNDKRPIYEQIVDKLTTLILRGVYEADEKLPSVRSMAVDLSINPNTIQKAYGELERQGFIYSIKGRGNFVRDMGNLILRKKEKALESLHSALTECRDVGIPEREIRKLVEKIYLTADHDREEKAQAPKENTFAFSYQPIDDRRRSAEGKDQDSLTEEKEVPHD